MVICFLDVVRSTEVMEREGFRATERLRTQLNDVQRRLSTVCHDAKIFIGERQGDGCLFAAERHMALGVLLEVLTIQQTANLRSGWLPMRFSVGIATPSWMGPAWGDGSTFNGRDVTVSARLMDECPSGGVVINRELHTAMHEYATELRDLFLPREADLKGFDISEGYWVMTPGIRVVVNSVATIRWAVAFLIAATLAVGMVLNAWMDHGRIKQVLDQQTCILTMSFDKREEFTKSYSPGSWAVACPWMVR